MTLAREGVTDIFIAGFVVKDSRTTSYLFKKTSQMTLLNQPTLFVV
jgi:hypothetical protein